MPETLTAGDILIIRQLAEYLMVSEKTVYRMLDRNQVPGVRMGRRVLDTYFRAGGRRAIRGACSGSFLSSASSHRQFADRTLARLGIEHVKARHPSQAGKREGVWAA